MILNPGETIRAPNSKDHISVVTEESIRIKENGIQLFNTSPHFTSQITMDNRLRRKTSRLGFRYTLRQLFVKENSSAKNLGNDEGALALESPPTNGERLSLADPPVSDQNTYINTIDNRKTVPLCGSDGPETMGNIPLTRLFLIDFPEEEITFHHEKRMVVETRETPRSLMKTWNLIWKVIDPLKSNKKVQKEGIVHDDVSLMKMLKKMKVQFAEMESASENFLEIHLLEKNLRTNNSEDFMGIFSFATDFTDLDLLSYKFWKNLVFMFAADQEGSADERFNSLKTRIGGVSILKSSEKTLWTIKVWIKMDHSRLIVKDHTSLYGYTPMPFANASPAVHTTEVLDIVADLYQYLQDRLPKKYIRASDTCFIDHVRSGYIWWADELKISSFSSQL